MSSLSKPHSGAIVPKELAGKWIAWDSSAGVIIASGSSLVAVMTDAQRLGELKPSFEKIPPADARLAGIAR